MKKIFIGMLFLIASFSVFAQNTISHIVVKDDTVTALARKYSVTIHDIYTLNPQAKNGIKLGETILLPQNNINKKFANSQGSTHIVQPKETLFGIAQKYGITIQSIEQSNSELLAGGLKTGSELVIPISKKTTSTTTVIKNDVIQHVVAPKETKFALSQKYGVSQEVIEAQNPHIANGLKVGDTVKVSKNMIQVEAPETIESIKNSVETNIKSDARFDYLDFKSNGNLPRKKVVLLLPFNTSKQNLESKAIQESFKRSSFMNIVVDFYAGAKLAIDKVNKLGGNFDIVVYDSEETPTSSTVEQIISSNDFSDVDVVIGPFFQSHSEKVASMLNNGKTIVVSPISKEGKAKQSNLFLSVPSTDSSKKAMLDFLKNKNQNTIAVVDRKKQSSRDFISQNFSNIQFVGYNEKGGVSAESLKSLLVKGKTNYVILETESTSMVLNVTGMLSGLKSDYDIKLVTLDRNDAFESDEIASSRLANLNFHYPSNTKDMTNDLVPEIYKEFKSVNNVFPSQFALRGYDVVYDVLLRLSQNQSFYKLADEVATEQLDSKFIYAKSKDGGYFNTGTYILYYDTDLTIKEAR